MCGNGRNRKVIQNQQVKFGQLPMCQTSCRLLF
jgi:hypothetical protein